MKSRLTKLWPLGILSGVGIYGFLILKPILQNRSDLRQKIEDLKEEGDSLAKSKEDLPHLNLVVQDLKRALESAKRELPEQREIPELLSMISDRARDSGLEVQLFRPSKEIFRDFYADVPVDFEVKGTYHDIARFFDEVGRFSRIVTIEDLSIRDFATFGSNRTITSGASYSDHLGSEGERQTLSRSIITTFRLLDEAEKARVKAMEKSEGVKIGDSRGVKGRR